MCFVYSFSPDSQVTYLSISLHGLMFMVLILTVMNCNIIQCTSIMNDKELKVQYNHIIL